MRNHQVLFGTTILMLTLQLVCQYSAHADLTVFTDRGAWEQAVELQGNQVATETFNEFQGFTTSEGGVTFFQFQEGTTTIGLLEFVVERPSGNLIVEGGSITNPFDSTAWRIEAATQNGDSIPVSPEVIFENETFAFGADWHFPLRSEMTIGSYTIALSDHVQIGFLGVVSSDAFDRIELDVVSPVNTIFYADDLSFGVVPEPSAALMLLSLIFLFAARRSKLSSTLI